MKCVCGNDQFYAHQIVRTDVIVNGNNVFESNPLSMNRDTGMVEEFFSIYDSEPPYGPYECTVCGREYEELK